MRLIVRDQCPSCGRPISDERLSRGLPCEKCLPDIDIRLLELVQKDRLSFLKELCNYIPCSESKNKFGEFLLEEESVQEFSKFFRNAIGNPPWSAQITWAKRVFKGKSFTILAPTGVGKSLFGIIMALYLATKGKKCYLIQPTSLLVKQTSDRLATYAEKLGLNVKVAAYIVKGGKEKTEVINRIAGGDYGILVTTSHFLSRNFELIKNAKFDFIFVDDVDSIIKSSKNIDRILLLLGLSQEAINMANKILRLTVSKSRFSEDRLHELNEARQKLKELTSNREIGVLVVSTATGRPRGLKVKLFRELLGFEIGSRTELLRNVVDSYLLVSEGDLEKHVAEVASRLGRGGLIFIQPGVSSERVEKLLTLLAEKGIKAELVTSKSKKAFSRFENGELDVLIGYATYYGLLVRGIDLPHIIRYAIFAGTPHFKFSAEVEEANPLRLLQIAQALRSVLSGSEAARLDRLTTSLRRRLRDLEIQSFRVLSEALNASKRPDGFLGQIYGQVLELRAILKELISRSEILKALEERAVASIRLMNGKPFLLIPDAPTYLQATGRTSRMFAGGISKGLSVVIADDEKLLTALQKQVSWYTDECSWVRFDELNLSKVVSEVDRDRELIISFAKGEVKQGAADIVRTALVVVESPTKARTIASFFGRPSMRKLNAINVYEVSSGGYILLIAASRGHVIDLVTDEGFWGVLVSDGKFVPIYATIKRCLNCGEQFTVPGNGYVCPYCNSTNLIDQQAVIDALREVASEIDTVFLATDPDTEGEKIAWDLYVLLKPYAKRIERIEFHEVTRRAFEEAIANPRIIDVKRVEAQLVRRIEDRWIGFSLSQKLWNAFGKQWLSAGRVQTPVLGWVIEQYEKVKKSFRTIFKLRLENGLIITLELDNLEKAASEVAKELKGSVAVIELQGVESVKMAPPPPLTTDTLLREAMQSLGFGVEETMRLAQDLFEMGLITYHRTDSPHVSSVGVGIAKSYIAEKFGEAVFRGRSWGPPGTHECIRPTRPHDADTLKALVNQGILQLARPLTNAHIRLYDLIFRRFMASQMSEAVVKIAKYNVKVKNYSKELTFYSDIVEHGFTAVYMPFKLARIEPGSYTVSEVRRRKMPAERLYTQADLVARMKEEGIGRPSTYAKIIAVLLERKYVVETKRHRLIPTRLGIDVFNYLSSEERYRQLVSVERTRKVEEIMDRIERGEVEYLRALKDFYNEVMTVVRY